MKRRSFIEKFVKRDIITNLDLKYPRYIKNTKSDVYVSSFVPKEVKAPSMCIDELIDLLNSLKSEGANRVYISDVKDFEGYVFYGVNLEEIKDI